MSNVHEPTRDELRTIAHGLADGLGIIDIAADIGIDRSTLSGWMKRDGFLVQVAKSVDTPADFGSERLENLLDEGRQSWERKSSYLLRLDFAAAVREAFPDFFASTVADEKRQAECARADQEFTIKALLILEDRGWMQGTADELARGLDTPSKRRDYRRRRGVKWDWRGLGCHFTDRWSAKTCKVRYADEEGMDFIEQRRRFGTDWLEVSCNYASNEELDATNERPLDVRRDPRLPVTVRAAEAFLRAVKVGADFAEAARAAKGE